MVMVLSVTPTVGPPLAATVVAVAPLAVRVPPVLDPPVAPAAGVPVPAGTVSPGASDVVVDSPFERDPLTTCWLSLKPFLGVLTEQDASTTAATNAAAIRHV